MRSSEQPAAAATATVPAEGDAPPATPPRSTLHVEILGEARHSSAPNRTQLQLVEDALVRLDASRTAVVEALGRDTGSIAAGHLRGAYADLEAVRRHLASARGLAR